MNLSILARNASHLASSHVRSSRLCTSSTRWHPLALTSNQSVPKNLRSLVLSTRCFTTAVDEQIQPTTPYEHHASPQQVLAEMLALPKPNEHSKLRPVNRIEMSAKCLFHRSVVAQLRQPGSRMVKRVRKKDLQIQIDPAPFIKDYTSSLYCHQRFGKTIMQGPLYDLRIQSGGLDEYGQLLDVSHVPFERIRVIVKNMQIHYLKAEPVAFELVYAPEDEPVRVRLPIRCINREKSPGLRDGGWLNQLRRNIEVRVEPFVKPPLVCSLDVGTLGMKDRLSIRNIVLEQRGHGVTPILPDDTVTTIVSKV